MKAEELRQRLETMSADNLRLLATQLYRMLPKKVAEQKGADRLISDPPGFLQTAKAKKAPDLPDIDMLGFETEEFLENASQDRYFAPNRIIAKSERSRWRFVARRLVNDWRLVAEKPENAAQAAKALESLYKILCRGCEVYLFPSADTFRAIGMAQSDFLAHLLLVKVRLHSPEAWATDALSLLRLGAHGDTTTSQLQDVFVATMKTAEHKETALQIISRQFSASAAAAGGNRQISWQQEHHRTNLLRLGFLITWALGEKDRAIQWLRTNARPMENAGSLLLRLVLETKDRQTWLREYEALRLTQPSQVLDWEKTYEHARTQEELPTWQIQ
jgi:hypothetical protein